MQSRSITTFPIVSHFITEEIESSSFFSCLKIKTNSIIIRSSFRQIIFSIRFKRTCSEVISITLISFCFQQLIGTMVCNMELVIEAIHHNACILRCYINNLEIFLPFCIIWRRSCLHVILTDMSNKSCQSFFRCFTGISFYPVFLPFFSICLS